MGGDGAARAATLTASRRWREIGAATDETFAVILGSDVCYEDPLPKALAHTLSKRLARPGVAWLTLPVRDWPGESGEAVIERLRNSRPTWGWPRRSRRPRTWRRRSTREERSSGTGVMARVAEARVALGERISYRLVKS